ncbi:bifunctional folylpolyglutamate synthase/dihydrofolate synthase [Ancylomarina longa]|uniref:bifunctional folylpolyglutamate synthase/dihydrofolate synthase n=1 Tax=Ancylomarina longa TaxID=2487017 RepID=UPI001EFF1D09|nr:Mur ligase family protein [Ancylomarina longa]
MDNTIALDTYFCHPHQKFKTIHVGGTNGKGSVSHALASVLQTCGLKVGLYTSPHLRDFRERIKINGVPIPKQEVVDFIANHKDEFKQIEPSFFEMTVALAFDFFARKKVDIAIIEVGLGGRLDSTNIISPILSVITNISKDHTVLLGNNLMQIAREKAGIIKSGIPVVIGEEQNESADVFRDIALENNSDIVFASNCYELKKTEILNDKQLLYYKIKRTGEFVRIECDLLGQYQQKNLKTILSVLELLIQAGITIHQEDILDGLGRVVSNTGLLGRWQILQESPRVICDTGHNIAGIKEIIEQIQRVDYRKLHVVFGMVNDKEIDEVLNLLPENAIYYFTKASIPRALNENILKEKGRQFNLIGNAYSTVTLAYKAAISASHVEDLIFVGGSTFVVAEVI